MNLRFTAHKMYLTKPTIKEKEDKLFSFPLIAEALDSVHKLPICAEPRPLKSCLKTANMDLEVKGCSFAPTICSIFPCQEKFSRKKPLGLPKYVCLRLAADDPI